MDDQGRFLDIFIGVPGKVHGSRMLQASTFFENWQQKMGSSYLFGDTAYISGDYPFIIMPKHDNGALTDDELQRNVKISCGRVSVEQAFGKMKCMWRRMRDLRNTRIDILVKLIFAACTLHNMILNEGESNVQVCEEHPHGCPRIQDEI